MAATVYEHKQDDYNTQDGYNMQQYKVSFSYYNVLLLYYIYLSMYLCVLISKTIPYIHPLSEKRFLLESLYLNVN